MVFFLDNVIIVVLWQSEAGEGENEVTLRHRDFWQGSLILVWLWAYLYEQEPKTPPAFLCRSHLFHTALQILNHKLKVTSKHLGVTVWSHFLSKISDLF